MEYILCIFQYSGDFCKFTVYIDITVLKTEVPKTVLQNFRNIEKNTDLQNYRNINNGYNLMYLKKYSFYSRHSKSTIITLWKNAPNFICQIVYHC